MSNRPLLLPLFCSAELLEGTHMTENYLNQIEREEAREAQMFGDGHCYRHHYRSNGRSGGVCDGCGDHIGAEEL